MMSAPISIPRHTRNDSVRIVEGSCSLGKRYSLQSASSHGPSSPSPVNISGSGGGAYIVASPLDRSASRLAVWKPDDEEPCSDRPGFRPGCCGQREVAAYRLDHGGSARVPVTTRAAATESGDILVHPPAVAGIDLAGASLVAQAGSNPATAMSASGGSDNGCGDRSDRCEAEAASFAYAAAGIADAGALPDMDDLHMGALEDDQPACPETPSPSMRRRRLPPRAPSTPIHNGNGNGNGNGNNVVSGSSDAPKRCPSFASSVSCSSTGHGRARAGSLQAFEASTASAEDVGPAVLRRVRVHDVHRVGLLDVRTANTDRHPGNLLIQGDWRGDPRCELGLVPIDHGYCLPSFLSMSDVLFEWSSWPQAKVPFDAGTLDYIAALDPDRDAAILERLGVEPEAVITMRLCTALLKAGAARRWTLADIASVMQRERFSEPSPLECAIGAAIAKRRHGGKADDAGDDKNNNNNNNGNDGNDDDDDDDDDDAGADASLFATACDVQWLIAEVLSDLGLPTGEPSCPEVPESPITDGGDNTFASCGDVCDGLCRDAKVPSIIGLGSLVKQ